MEELVALAARLSLTDAESTPHQELFDKVVAAAARNPAVMNGEPLFRCAPKTSPPKVKRPGIGELRDIAERLPIPELKKFREDFSEPFKLNYEEDLWDHDMNDQEPSPPDPEILATCQALGQDYNEFMGPETDYDRLGSRENTPPYNCDCGNSEYEDDIKTFRKKRAWKRKLVKTAKEKGFAEKEMEKQATELAAWQAVIEARKPDWLASRADYVQSLEASFKQLHEH